MSNYKEVRRVVYVLCLDCLGTGENKKSSAAKCLTCNGRGEVPRRVVEIVQDENEVEAK